MANDRDSPTKGVGLSVGEFIGEIVKQSLLLNQDHAPRLDVPLKLERAARISVKCFPQRCGGSLPELSGLLARRRFGRSHPLPRGNGIAVRLVERFHQHRRIRAPPGLS